MVVDAFVLPVPGRSLGVVFWDRARGSAGRGASDAAGLAVYAPGTLSRGELVELRRALITAVGEALAGPTVSAPARVLWTWWILGVLAVLSAIAVAGSGGLAFVWLAILATGATLPFGISRATTRATRAALRLVRRLPELEPMPGDDARQRERLMALWQTARKLRGSETEQLRALESACREQSWPAAARVYADLVSADAPPPERRGLRGWIDRVLRRGSASQVATRPYGTVSLRAWP